MSSRTRVNYLGAIVTIAEADRQFREIKGLIDRSLQTAQRYWVVFPLLAASWAFIVSDDERFEVLEHLADKVLDSLPLDPLERLLTP
jgi:hypothetical protein